MTTVTCLVDNGAHVSPRHASQVYNTTTDVHERHTPLTAAAQCGHTHVCAYLLQQGADPHTAPTSDDSGSPYTALECALANAHVDTARALLHHTAELKTTHHSVLLHALQCSAGRRPPASGDHDQVDGEMVSIVKLLCDTSEVPLATLCAHANAKGSTPLHLCIQRRLPRTLECMLLRLGGERVDVRDNRLSTPLHCACQTAFVEGVRLLIQAGADVLAKDKRGRTPLDLAQRSSRKEKDVVVRLLEGAGEGENQGQELEREPRGLSNGKKEDGSGQTRGAEGL